MENLIRNDQGFGDGFFAMGDFLYSDGKEALAVLAYRKALEVGHPNEEVIKGRLEAIEKYWEVAGVEEKERMTAAIAAECFEDGEEWLKQFQAMEAALIARGDMPTPKQVEAIMEKREIEAPVPPTGGFWSGVKRAFGG